MTTPRLSICIATLNRAAFIGATLDSIIAQATDDVEIVIVDGASTDNTSEIIEQRQTQFPHLRYQRLPTKGGVDRDYCRAVELAQGEYCWLMSDDDLLKPGAIARVLSAAQSNFSLMVVNAEICSANLSALIHESSLPFTTDRIYAPHEGSKLFAEVATYMSFIGCVVIKREIWKARDKETYIGTDFIHVGVVFQRPLPAPAILIAAPLISIRYGNASWTAKAFETWLFKWPKLIWSFADYPDSVKKQISPREPWRSHKFLLIYRAKGAFSIREYQAWLRPRLTSRLPRFLARAIASAPGCWVNTVLLGYFSLFHPELRLLMIDFRNSSFYYRTCLRSRQEIKHNV